MDFLLRVVGGLSGALVVLLVFASSGVSFLRRAPILGVGLALVGLSSLLGLVFAYFLSDLLYRMFSESGLPFSYLGFFWPINSIFAAFGWVLVVVGISRLPKSG
jgi:hypothetical protein